MTIYVFKQPIVEWCQHCGYEVYLRKPYDICPICNHSIVACSMCDNPPNCVHLSVPECFTLHRHTETEYSLQAVTIEKDEICPLKT